MANTYVAIATTTVGSAGTTSIDFTNIPQTYTDLCIKFSARTDRNDGDYDNTRIRFNSSTSNYSARTVGAYLNTVSSGQNIGFTNAFWSLQYGATATLPASIFSNGELYIPNYTSSNNKSISSDMGYSNSKTSAPNNDWLLLLGTGLWSDTSAITSISLFPGWNAGAKLVQYTTATLYGIKNT